VVQRIASVQLFDARATVRSRHWKPKNEVACSAPGLAIEVAKAKLPRQTILLMVDRD
jgi:hypothetical protein